MCRIRLLQTKYSTEWNHVPVHSSMNLWTGFNYHLLYFLLMHFLTQTAKSETLIYLKKLKLEEIWRRLTHLGLQKLSNFD